MPDRTRGELSLNFSEVVQLIRKEFAYENLGYAKAAKILDYAIEPVIQSEVTKALDSIKAPTIADVFPSEPYDGTNTYKDMVSMVDYYKSEIERVKKDFCR